MKKINIYISLILLISFILLSCSDNSVEETVISQKITPGIKSDEYSDESDSYADISGEIQFLTAQIIIDKDYSIIEIQNIDLDSDQIDEQIIVASPVNNNKKKFKLYIAYYDAYTDEYEEIYSTEISSMSLKTASINTEDITGDHNIEILISGIDIKGLQIFEIYKFSSDKSKRKIAFSKIFSTNIDGDFKIDRFIRSNDYKVDKLKSDSFNIEIQRKNPDDDKNLIVEKYKWSETLFLYELSSMDKVKLSTVTNENLLKLYRGTSGDFLRFLSGPWYKTNHLDGSPTHNMDEIVQFLVDKKTLTFYSNNTLESFIWTQDPYRFGRGSLSILNTKNDLIQSIVSNIQIHVDSLQSIRIEIKRNKRWGGTYTQLNETLKNVLTDTSRDNYLLSELDIKGLYKSNLNTEIIFDYPQYILKEDDKESHGIYTIFTLNKNQILEMKELNSNGLTMQIKSYKMTYNETGNDIRIIRTITLNKGSLQSKGIVLESNSELHFEQIEKVIQGIADNQP